MFFFAEMNKQMSAQVLVSKTQNQHFGAKVPFLPDRLTNVLNVSELSIRCV